MLTDFVLCKYVHFNNLVKNLVDHSRRCQHFLYIFHSRVNFAPIFNHIKLQFTDFTLIINLMLLNKKKRISSNFKKHCCFYKIQVIT